MNDVLSKVPILRILIPFVPGIVLASHYKIPSIIAIILMILSIIAIIIFHFSLKVTTKLTRPYIYNSPIIIFIACLGILCYNINKPKELTSKELSYKYAEAKITTIHDNDFSSSMTLDIFNCIDSCGNKFNLNQNMTAWIENNDYSLKEGDIILIDFNPQRILSSGNPEEFDYAKYLQNKGFIYHLYINKGNYRKIGHNGNIFSWAKQIQHNLINLIHDSSLKPSTKTFFITILLGDSSNLEQDIRENISYAGIAHILALSGLHISIIALLFGLLFYPLNILGSKRLRLITTLVLIVLFSFIVGLPISVIRATTMIAFVIIAEILQRDNNSTNALFASAILILIITPTAIYDIGFQFSFTSVLLILLLSNKLTTINPKHKISHYTITLFTTTTITSLGTIWLTAYYFNYISIFSIFSNIIIIPLLPFIIGFGFIYLILLSCGINCDFLTKLLDGFYNFITSFSIELNQTPYSYINNIYISTFTLWMSIISIILFILFIYKKRVVYIYSLICIVFGAIINNYIESAQTPNIGYIIFNDKQCTPILSFENDTAHLLISDDTIGIESFLRKHKKFLAKYNIKDISVKTLYSNNQILFANKKMAIINDNTLNHYFLSPKIDVDYLLITSGYYGTIQTLLNSYNINKIILSGDIYYKRIQLFKQECNLLKIPCHIISEQGAVSIFFN